MQRGGSLAALATRKQGKKRKAVSIIMDDSSSIPASSGIYRIICVVTGKFYIGSAVHLRRRKTRHFSELRNNRHQNPKLQRAWNKYGEQSFAFEIIELVLLPDALTMREQCWIDTLNPDFNISPTAGSNLGMKYSREAIEKSRSARIGRKPSPETRARISESRRGKPSTRIGYKASPETIERQRMAHLGKKQSDELIRKRIAPLKGRERNPEAIEKTRQANLGRKNTPESIARMSAAQKGHKGSPHINQMKTYILTSPDGSEYVVRGLGQFCRAHALNTSNLVQVAKGNAKQHKGWKARYA